MVRAYCTTGPCDPFYTFAGGSTLIRRVKQPKPVTNRKFGKIRINSLQALGPPPLPTTLDVEVSGTIFYGSDLNAVCPLANTVVTGPFGTSTMNCVPGAAGDANCSGNLFFIDFTAPGVQRCAAGHSGHRCEYLRGRVHRRTDEANRDLRHEHSGQNARLRVWGGRLPVVRSVRRRQSCRDPARVLRCPGRA